MLENHMILPAADDEAFYRSQQYDAAAHDYRDADQTHDDLIFVASQPRRAAKARQPHPFTLKARMIMMEEAHG